MSDKKSALGKVDGPSVEPEGGWMKGWSNSPEDRSDRARRIREWRALEREIRRDRFLQDWLDTAEASERWLTGEKLTRSEIQEFAEDDGYRTAADWLASRKQQLRMHRHFVHAPVFRKLWALLREHDRTGIGAVPSYGPSRGSVPARLLEAVVHWHQAPKLTSAERKKLSQKIVKACEELESLVAQVSPSHKLDDQYARFRFEDVTQARAVFKAFGADTTEADKAPSFGTAWRASHTLQACGVVPLWAIQNIKLMALANTRSANTLPTKVRAKTAQRTYLIGAVQKAIDLSAMATPAEVGIDRHLMAEIVGLIADIDCSADDVRKALEATRQEDS